MFKINNQLLPLAIILFGIIAPSSALSVEELTAQHSEEIIRQTKSEEIKRYMNFSVDPCDDFYEFTCGNYPKYHPTTLRHNLFDTLKEQMTRKLADMLQTAEEGDSDSDRKVKNFYKSCLSIPENMQEFGNKLKEIIAEFGTMAVVEGERWQESNFEWSKVLAQMVYQADVGILFNIGDMTDFNDDTIKRPYIGEPPLLLDEWSFYVDAAFSSRLQSHVVYIAGNLVSLLGVERDLALQTAIDIKDFEVTLAQAMTSEKLDLSPEERYTLTDIDELQRKFGHLCDFKTLFLDAQGSTPSHLYVDTHYVENVLDILQNTPKRVVNNYLYYSYLNAFIPPITRKKPVMQQNCIEATREQFSNKLDNMIYRRYFTAPMEQAIYHMWRQMKIQFRNILQSRRLNWIRDDTRTEALAKLKSMKMVINSHEKINFTEEFEDLDLNEDYVHNIRTILMSQGQQAREELEKPPEKEEMGGESFSPYYHSLENTVYLPIGSVQPYYLWATAFPYAYNFASLGSIIGHEIVHGFDDSGRKYDSECNERDWWDSDADSNFRERTKCFANQYKQYIYAGKPLPEMSVQKENIADNGGMRLAYEAYLNWYGNAERANQNLHSEVLDGIDATPRQIFFISFAHTWCTSIDSEYKAVQMATDPHTPEKFRVIGSLSNYDEFSKVFHCPKGSGMNPISKCEIY